MDNSFKKRGFNDYFQREEKEKKIPFLSSFDVDSYIEDISATRISGGVIKSKDGKLVINLETGELTYNGDSVI